MGEGRFADQDALARGATVHTLRHTFASEFMRTGGRLADLQLLLGHSTVQQTEKYVHFAPDYVLTSNPVVTATSR